MADDRPRYGPLVATVSSAALAVSVFLPWYGVSLTANGTAYFQQEAQTLATQYGNASLQSEVGSLNAKVGALAGVQVATVSAHEALKYLSVVILLIAAAAFLTALLGLVSTASFSPGASSLAGLGALAAVCVVFRMCVRPLPPGGDQYLSLSLQYGAWLALLSSVGVLLGGAWPHRSASPDAGAMKQSEELWSGLSGWTPDA
jgi:hypothetical protein